MVIVLLFIGTFVVLLSCLGVATMPTYSAAIHYIGPASTFGAATIAAAVLLQEGFSQYGIKSGLMALFLILAAPVTAHAIGRAGRIRRTGRLTVVPHRHSEQ